MRRNSVAALFHRGRRSPPEAAAVATRRARHEDRPIPEGPPGGNSTELMEMLGFRSAGAHLLYAAKARSD